MYKRQAARFERTPRNLPVAVSPEKDNAELARVLNLASPPCRIEGFDISNISGTLKVASVVAFRDGRPDRAHYRRMKITSVEGQDDFACIAEAVKRRYTRLLRENAPRESRSAGPSRGAPDDPEAGRAIPGELQQMLRETTHGVQSARSPERATGLPDLIVVDGGKGQLNAACEELRKLGLSDLPVIGLAKEFEEIHRPGQPMPLRLSPGNNALKLLQRIRDESHRVANSYNAQLRLRKISESVLDEFPGIGESRKAALLRRFGSIQRLRTATVDQIAEVPGFGLKSARDLRDFLNARS